ncbi:MAG: hypothetical protein KAS63_07810 [Candidatus Heimdallarchaeota archaeon]|nr:hypothetical protein [Candidatus Heimdallarchaeota archaeon]MCK4955254.1 hypothetical protein [Candidatus Heimdallarchaeota archaeon]
MSRRFTHFLLAQSPTDADSTTGFDMLEKSNNFVLMLKNTKPTRITELASR